MITEDSDLIEVRDLKQYYRGGYALDGVSFKLKNGGIYGVYDADGKSAHVLFALLSGALLPDAGWVRVNGLDTVKDPVASRRTVGYVPADAEAYADMTVEEYMTLIADAKGLDFELSAREVQEILDAVELRTKRHTLCVYLSAGERRRLALAQALLGSPEFILLEDPFKNLADRDVYDMFDRVLGLGDGKTVFVSAAPSMLSTLAQEVLVLRDGKLLGVFDVQDEALREVYAALGVTNEEESYLRVRRKRMHRDQRRRTEEREGDEE